MFDFLIHSGVVILKDGPARVDIGVKNGYIKHIGSIDRGKARRVFDASSLHVFPGFVDTQVHFRQCSEDDTELAEDFSSGSQSAVLGGITAIFDMPNTHLPLVNYSAFHTKLEAMSSKMACDFALYVGAADNNMQFLEEMMKKGKTGVCGIKVFLGNSTGGLCVKDPDYLLSLIRKFKKITVHSEEYIMLKAQKDLFVSRKLQYEDHSAIRPVRCAAISTEKVCFLASCVPGCHVHILHIGTKDEIDIINKYRKIAHKVNSRITAEITPHHLAFSSPDDVKVHKSLIQVNPPIRSKEHQESLWNALKDNFFDLAGSDHAPHSLFEKQKPYPLSPSGMPGVATLVPFFLNAVNEHKISLEQCTALLAYGPHHVFDILKKKGYIENGWKADFTIVDMKKKKKVSSDTAPYKCGWSPFYDTELVGWPVATVIRGKLVMCDGDVLLPNAGVVL